MSVWSREKREQQATEETYREALATIDRVMLLVQRVNLAVEERKCQQQAHPKK